MALLMEHPGLDKAMPTAARQKIRYLYQENRGLGGARNTGLGLVETTYVSFLDSDDWLMPDYVERILGRIEEAGERGEQPEIIMTLPVIWNEKSRVAQDWYDRELFLQIFPRDGCVVNPQKSCGCISLK